MKKPISPHRICEKLYLIGQRVVSFFLESKTLTWRDPQGSQEAMLNDLSWLGLDWDEGPGAGGEYGPYHQSEHNYLYKQYAEKLLNSENAYRCFCSNEELEQMKETAKQMQLPPLYTGKWATASEEVQKELEKGTPYTYYFRVPKGRQVKILVESEHSPCPHALGFPMPSFAHVSLILAPDRIKLSKRHGATSEGQFREMGYLPQEMVNYLALLGWDDGTENEFFTIDQLAEKFSINHVNKSGAIFDSTKLRWMNGQHLRALPSEELCKILGDRWKTGGILLESERMFVKEAAELLKDGIDLVTDGDKVLSSLLEYPLNSTLASTNYRFNDMCSASRGIQLR
ncbi:hypothetical protein J5N97_018111 [Dioscorea zingiberensis]|uniref:Glutamyl/glutaminyl-tRNA synthetase class Ib catalytic domain-containing protein n=1 Tax=Dioscorea zingiberensis TaxID=325984 RepID=A0A9D5CMK5_9LILI|nr:hypothetical protein J5N97_018111 [Dioscorea zingiberensis]